VARAGHLEHGREALKPSVAQKDRQPVADQALLHVRVAVAVRAEWRLRVVDVQGTEPVEADRLVELVE
jgi:hypothetical protein